MTHCDNMSQCTLSFFYSYDLDQKTIMKLQIKIDKEQLDITIIYLWLIV
jgi:hypothetical protein